ncbi:MAG: DNA polymerase Y family protein, partial [Acidobacteria bacterium]
MDRLACVDVPALPLQLLLRREPGWRDVPAVVVERDHPQARVLWVSEAARRSQVLPGMRYAQALSLERGLRAGVVEREEIRRGVAALVRRLHGFAPRVEADDDEPGTFWLDVSGLRRLWPSATAWAEAVRRDLAADGFRASVVVGFTRFGTFAMARVTDGCRVFADPAAEQVAARNVPLARLDIDPAMRAQLARLGVHTVGAFLELPAGGVRERWGPEAHRLRLLAAGELRLPLDPRAVERPLRRTLELE